MLPVDESLINEVRQIAADRVANQLLEVSRSILSSALDVAPWQSVLDEITAEAERIEALDDFLAERPFLRAVT